MSTTLLEMRDIQSGHNVPRKATERQEVFRPDYLQQDCDWPLERDVGSVEKSDGSAILISNEANISADSSSLGISDVTPRVQYEFGHLFLDLGHSKVHAYLDLQACIGLRADRLHRSVSKLVRMRTCNHNNLNIRGKGETEQPDNQRRIETDNDRNIEGK